MTISEYSVAYTHETDEDLALLTRDFLCFLENLHEAEHFQRAKADFPEGLFERFFASELIEAEALPESWQDKLTTLVASIKDGNVKCSDVDKVFGLRRPRAAYQAGYTQALIFLVIDVFNNNPDKPEPKPYEPVLTLIEKPSYRVPFVALSSVT
ncbi:hypothetical protein [Leucothrix arctica]|uniref:Uncharacterized protein n=1 Tax=Leucothrix arctica TaxID=1481894 RepID=A0A317CMJ4_9GAMM|nr:hypothetical protein [Leucothrix arctica]PWQ99437.1 hypothetical protein DKT75_00955 [Leucothrix arctica]